MAEEPVPGFKLSYHPTVIGGTGLGAVMALLIYYRVLDVEAAGLWSVALGFFLPPITAWLMQRYTTSSAKLHDADISAHEVERKALANRRERHARSHAARGAP
jgi:hypothetical protein